MERDALVTERKDRIERLNRIGRSTGHVVEITSVDGETYREHIPASSLRKAVEAEERADRNEDH